MIDFHNANNREQSRAPAVTRLAYKPAEAAAQLGISERSLWTLNNQGKIRSIKIGRSVRYPHAELERFLAEELEQ
jgi:excisionase family DNA binding protein